METAIKEIGLSWKGRNKSFMVGGIMILGSIILSASFNRIVLMPLVFGIVSIVIGSLTAGTKIFKFYPKHFVFQPSAVHKRLILNDDLVSFEVENRKITIHYNDAGSNKKIKILKEVITQEDVDVLRNTLNEIIVNRVGE
ncbi:hypothetical protein [Tenacibaculum sp. M341]|uniref:hypothetical protein n=1 Tax=Tenacibaculum sp. M341 TaxID=2530339 RepID=UPI00105081C6|nr:hypothetical protein [Tenacibaculum sp. M341]TCI95003.1 hypothetical protein EYW44_01385 [Tenacibaculum sp. M341]